MRGQSYLPATMIDAMEAALFLNKFLVRGEGKDGSAGCGWRYTVLKTAGNAGQSVSGNRGAAVAGCLLTVYMK